MLRAFSQLLADAPALREEGLQHEPVRRIEPRARELVRELHRPKPEAEQPAAHEGAGPGRADAELRDESISAF